MEGSKDAGIPPCMAQCPLEAVFPRSVENKANGQATWKFPKSPD